jgi:predicted nucleic acid-binding protein
MGVLVDTSVWVDHFRNGNDALVGLIERDLVLVHEMVIVEIACGTPPAPRVDTLRYLGLLQHCKVATLAEVAEFIEQEKLFGLGCGLVDLALLASTLITPGAELWTLDRKLAELAAKFSVVHDAKLH